ncbi:MAG: AbrB/MazE/SpoVT family DNA-binding domain-containing protein [Candidatus Limnocylindrales bacterium]
MLSVKVSSKHQVAVPSAARSALGIEAGDRLDVLIGDGELILRPRPSRPSDRLRGLAAGQGWYGSDPVTFVRALREASDARTLDREELIAHAAGGSRPRRPRQQRADLPARGQRQVR